MFTTATETTTINVNNIITIDSPLINTNTKTQPAKIYNKTYANNTEPKITNNAITLNTLDKMLEKEKNFNKTDSWNKLDKTIKNQKLHSFAEKYGKENNLPVKDIKSLKSFFIDCLEKNKLQKTKEVNYDKEKREIISIPSLFFNTTSRSYTLKIVDNKRISTLKSLTPKRSTPTIHEPIEK